MPASTLRIRAGARSDHRFIAVWPVVIDGRVFVRSWTLKPDGWYRKFLEDPLGAIQIGERQLPVRAARVRSERILTAVERAYAERVHNSRVTQVCAGFPHGTAARDDDGVSQALTCTECSVKVVAG